MMKTLNNLFVLEPYKQGQGIKGEQRSGLMMPKQKNTLFGLKLLVDAKVEGIEYPAGSIAYIKEDQLMTSQWAKDVRSAEGVSGDFIVVPGIHVVMVGDLK